jgi:thiol-disulfide isomerase/thioredoxin
LHKALIAVLIGSAIIAGFSLGRILDSNRQLERGSRSQAPVYPTATELIGRPRPDFSLSDLANRPRAISEWDGRALLINFWATWCAPCREEIPALNAARAEFQQDGFEVIGIALDEADQIAAFRQQVPMDYPILLGQAAADEVLRRYGNNGGGLPYSVFIDTHGIIRSIYTRGALDKPQLREMILKLLK